MLDLQRNQIDVEGKNCLLLGWGGAARGVRFALQRLGAASVWALSRRPDEAAQVFPYRALPDLAAKADLIVNCTPLGMPPYQDASPWPEQIEFPKRAVLYDLIYIPAVTRLMHTAQDAGARAIGGIGMLAYQAALSFQKWTGEEPPFDLYLEAARNALVAEVP
jgi:shikimate dehydrogenase